MDTLFLRLFTKSEGEYAFFKITRDHLQGEYLQNFQKIAFLFSKHPSSKDYANPRQIVIVAGIDLWKIPKLIETLEKAIANTNGITDDDKVTIMLLLNTALDVPFILSTEPKDSKKFICTTLERLNRRIARQVTQAVGATVTRFFPDIDSAEEMQAMVHNPPDRPLPPPRPPSYP